MGGGGSKRTEHHRAIARRMIIEVRNESDLCFQLDGEWLKAGDFKTATRRISCPLSPLLRILTYTLLLRPLPNIYLNPEGFRG